MSTNRSIFKLYRLLSLRQDQADSEVIDDSIRSGVKVAGTNLWVLIFAILVASVGLNVNSTAVIIGAMLISPLMGPIVGIGYAAAVHDFELIKLALRNLLIFTGISLLTSFLYFLLSPIDTAQSELLARTTPTLWDVLIAFFGGCAGMIALTRQSMSNVVPGVAIATALMPPLCTAGFGLAIGRWDYFAGALFLYTINSVFIASATLALAKIMALPKRAYINESKQLRAKLLIGSTIFCTIVPSVYLAYRFVQGQIFSSAVDKIVLSLKQQEHVVLDKSVDALGKKIRLTLAGSPSSDNLSESIQQRLYDHGVRDADIQIKYAGSKQVDVHSLKEELRQDLYANMAQQITQLQTTNDTLSQTQRQQQQQRNNQERLLEEIKAQYPSIVHAAIGSGVASTPAEEIPENSKAKSTTDDATATDYVHTPITLIAITSHNELPSGDKTRIANWMNVRLGGAPFDVLYNTVRTTSFDAEKAKEAQDANIPAQAVPNEPSNVTSADATSPNTAKPAVVTP